jgi:hypothetical protein
MLTAFNIKDVYSTGDIAAILGVTRKTAGSLLDRGGPRCYRLAPPCRADRRVRHGDLMAWLRRTPGLADVLATAEAAERRPGGAA